MRYHNITKDDMLNGEGLRVVLWVSGCSHHCEGCHNAVTWDPEGGLAFDAAAAAAIRFIRAIGRKSNGWRGRSSWNTPRKISGCIQATAGRKSAHCR